jgi:hypothetical protein
MQEADAAVRSRSQFVTLKRGSNIKYLIGFVVKEAQAGYGVKRKNIKEEQYD